MIKVDVLDVQKYQNAFITGSATYMNPMKEEIIKAKGLEYYLLVQKTYLEIVDHRIKMHKLLYWSKK